MVSDMSEFHDFFTSKNFIGAYNVFSSGDIKDKNKGIIYVEDASDYSFWEGFIGYHYPNEYMCRPSSKEGKTVTGKRFLEKIYKDANEKIIIAVDSDYDYIASKVQEDHIFNHNKYVIHTHGFSRESVQIEKDSLDHFFKLCRLTIPNTVNLSSFLNDFSEIAFKGLAKYIVILNRIDYSNIYDSEFNSCFHLLDENMVDENLLISKSGIEKIEKKMDLFFDDKCIYEDDIIKSEYFLNDIGINRDNAYRFISGHVLFDLIKKIHKINLSQLMKHEIKNINKNVTGNEIKDRVNQVKTRFNDSFSFDTYCHMRQVDLEDEVHKFILSAIKNIK